MSGAELRPPAWSRRLLEWAAERLGTPELGADAEELFAQERRRHGGRAARRWYRRQTRAALWRLLRSPRTSQRVARGPARLAGIALDLKFGARMLLKHPLMSVAAVLALAVAMALAASWFEFISDIAYPRLALPEGDRIVSVGNRDQAAGDIEPRSLYDFEIWREELESVEDLSAASTLEFNLATDDDRYATLVGARVTPSLFRLLRVQPLLGRTLTEADLDPATEPAVVIGFAAWQRLFDGDRTVIGRRVRLGSAYATVVGVMPEGFGFPRNHELWTPLRDRAVDHGPREGPPIRMFGRLAPGATLDEARAELAVIGERTAAELPATHENLSPDVRRFGRNFARAALATAINLPFLLFLVVISANVATLFFARAATRESEIALRSALGASRRRIILQLVGEALALTSLAALLGLVAAGVGLHFGMDLFWEVQQSRPPFWWDSGLTPTTVLYVFALAVLSAVVIGGVPGLRATGRRLRHRLAQPGAGGSAMRFGAVATGVIIVQVALCVAFIPQAILAARNLLPEARGEAAFPAAAYLTGRVTRQPEPERVAGLFDEVRRRLALEPGVLEATRAGRIPGINHPFRRFEIEGDSASNLIGRTLEIDPNFFDVMGARIATGRAFRTSDVTGEAGVAIVERTWAQYAFGGRNPIGRRIRISSGDDEQAGSWYEVVGTVTGMERAIGPGTPVHVYIPLRPSVRRTSVQFYLRSAGPPEALTPRVYDLVAAIDPALDITAVMSLANVWRPLRRASAFFASALGVVGGIILLFALIGIYALTSFTVAQRTREIGIRTALGAGPRRIITAIFSRTLAQIGLGILTGAVMVSLAVMGEPDGLRLVAAVAAAMVTMGALGCALPAARALRIQPTEALRQE